MALTSIPPFAYFCQPRTEDELRSLLHNNNNNDTDDKNKNLHFNDIFRRYGLLWIRPSCSSSTSSPSPSSSPDSLEKITHKKKRRRRRENKQPDDNNSQCDILKTLMQLYPTDPSSFEKHWTVENRGNVVSKTKNNNNKRVSNGDDDDEALSAMAILGRDSQKCHDDETADDTTMKFYVSTIIPRDSCLLSPLFKNIQQHHPMMLSPPTTTPASTNTTNNDDNPAVLSPRLMEQTSNIRYNGGCWLFLGRNPPPTSSTTTPPPPLSGRAEHVDDLSHTGTWHVQLSGTKTWILRPDPNASDWIVEGIPDITRADATTDDVVRDGGVTYGGKIIKSHRLRLRMERGDLLILNTRAWFHRTELEEQQQQEWSMSLARDFYLSRDVVSEVDAKKGDVLLEEDNIPDDLPCGNDDVANCALAEVDIDDADEEEEEEEGDAGTTEIVLIATRDISKGDRLILSSAGGNDDNDDDDDDASDDDSDNNQACNAAECVDPRVISKRDWGEGEVVLSDDDIPDDVPRSHDFNCQLEMIGDDRVVLKALRSVTAGEVFTIAPDDEEEYDEVEVDLATGEIDRDM